MTPAIKAQAKEIVAIYEMATQSVNESSLKMHTKWLKISDMDLSHFDSSLVGLAQAAKDESLNLLAKLIDTKSHEEAAARGE